MNNQDKKEDFSAYGSYLHKEILGTINSITSRTMEDPGYNMFSAMDDMTRNTESFIISLSNEFSKNIGIGENIPYGVFIFGSPSRNEMLPYSDLDIGIIHNNKPSSVDCSHLTSLLKGLPFDKVDIANWDSIESMAFYVKTSLVEGNQAIDAKFVIGNIGFEQEYRTLEVRTKHNSLERKFVNFICEDYFLHRYDYPNKKKEYGPNLKYNHGASRDIIFLNWFTSIIREINGEDTSINGLRLIDSIEYLEPIDRSAVYTSIDLINLIKNTALKCSKEDNSPLLRSLNQYTINKVFEKVHKKIKWIGISTNEELHQKHLGAQEVIIKVIQKIKKRVIEIIQIKKGRIWGEEYKAIFGKNFTANNLVDFLKGDDMILQNIAIWEKSHLCNTEELSIIIKLILRQESLMLFVNLMAILTNPNLSKKDLWIVLSHIINSPGYEFLLRLIHKHPNSDQFIRRELTNSKLIDPKYKISNLT